MRLPVPPPATQNGADTQGGPGVTVVSPRMGKDGWPFATADPFPAADADPLHGAQHVKDLYLKASSEYEGRYVSTL